MPPQSEIGVLIASGPFLCHFRVEFEKNARFCNSITGSLILCSSEMRPAAMICGQSAFVGGGQEAYIRRRFSKRLLPRWRPAVNCRRRETLLRDLFTSKIASTLLRIQVFGTRCRRRRIPDFIAWFPEFAIAQFGCC